MTDPASSDEPEASQPSATSVRDEALPPGLRQADPSDRQLARDVVLYGVPVVIGTLSHTVLDIADTVMVGRLGENELAAVGLATFAALIAVVILGAVQVGTQAIAGRRVGEGDEREAGRVLDGALIITLVAGGVASVAGWWGARIPFLASKNELVADLATSYFAIRALGLLPAMITYTFRGFFFGIGRMKFSMWLMVGVNFTNVVLNAILIFGLGPIPAMGTDGAALATTISISLGAVACLIAVALPTFRARYGTLRFGGVDRALVGSIIRVSLPRVFQAFALTCFYTFIAIIEQVGTDEAAAANIVFKVHSLPFHVALGTGLAAATLIAQSLGAGRPEIATRYGDMAARLGFLSVTALGVLYAVLARPIVSIFTTFDSVVEVGVAPFVIVALAQGIDAVGIIYARSLHGAGDTIYVLIAELVTGWGIFVPLAVVLALVLKAPITIVWLAYVGYMISFALASWLRFRSGRWKGISV